MIKTPCTRAAMSAGSISLFLFATLSSAGPFELQWQEIAPGVHAGIREDSTRVPVMGTTTLVVGDEGVVVFDGGGVPRMSELVIEKIRTLGELPVTHVVISHWHQDHNWGIRAFIDAWPNLQVVAHPYTRQSLLSQNPEALRAIRSDKDAKTQLAAVEEALASDERVHDHAWLRQFAEDVDEIDREYKRIEPLYPSLSFDKRLVIHSGERQIELLHPGKGNTAGDVILWLPEERIVAVGDLVVRPTPYGFGSHPSAWADTLRTIKALDYRILVPGHGELLHDSVYLDLLVETLEVVTRQMEALVEEGVPEDKAVEQLDLSSVEERFTGGDDFLAARFHGWFKAPIARAAYRVASGEDPEV